MSYDTTSSERTRGEQDHEQYPDSKRDFVFNDETCRALRRGGRDFGRLVAVIGTFLLAEIAVIVLHAISLAPLADLALTAAGLIGGSVVTVGVMKRVNLVPTRETLREMKRVNLVPTRETLREMKRDLTREARAIAGDPQAIESRGEETSKPSARPELAFGLPPSRLSYRLWSTSSGADRSLFCDQPHSLSPASRGEYRTQRCAIRGCEARGHEHVSARGPTP